MIDELEIKIKTILSDIPWLEACQFVISDHDDVNEKFIELKVINNQAAKIGSPAFMRDIDYYTVIQRDLKNERPKAGSFLLQLNLKIDDIKYLDLALNKIKDLNLVNLDFQYSRELR